MARLPAELYASIACHAVPRTRRMLYLSSHAFYDAAAVTIYHSVVCTSKQSPVFLKSILSNKWLGGWVVSLELSLYVDEGALAAFTPALSLMPNIHRLMCKNLCGAMSVDATCVDVVAGLQKLEAIMCSIHQTFDMEQLFARLRPLKHISFAGRSNTSPEFENLIVRSQLVLEKVSVFRYPFDALVQRLPSGTVFPKLKQVIVSYLSLQSLSTTVFPVLENLYTVEMEELQLLRQNTLPALCKMGVTCSALIHSGTRLEPNSHRPPLKHLTLNLEDLEPDSPVPIESNAVEDINLNVFLQYMSVIALRDLLSLYINANNGWQLGHICGAIRRLGPIKLRCLRLCGLVRGAPVTQELDMLRELVEEGMIPELETLSVMVREDDLPEGVTPGQMAQGITPAQIACREAELGRLQRRLFQHLVQNRARAGGVWSDWVAVNDQDGRSELQWPATLFNHQDADIIDALLAT
ncbi:hypothetical protein BKA62DRAFT_753223 [Auriculariales sp. MPI-PUGE-AT-0066]|nr:hypothetical protein BKA62DRAFT_753223 [Auriculariales sp. MPI-PUGE-AT-0066]